MELNEHKFPQLKYNNDEDEINYIRKQNISRSNPNNKSNPPVKMFCTYCHIPGHSISMCWKKKNTISSPVVKQKPPP